MIKWSFDNYRVIWKIQNNLTQPMAQLPTCMLFPRPAKSFYAVPCLSDICSACLLIALFYQSTPSCLKFIKWGLGGGGPCDFSVSPFVQIPPLVFDLIWTWTRAWQFSLIQTKTFIWKKINQLQLKIKFSFFTGQFFPLKAHKKHLILKTI